MSTKNKTVSLLLLHLAILIYSVSAVFMKYAATSESFSFRFFLFYLLALLALLVYAVFWQQILRHFKLSFAYTNRAVGMLWTVLFGVLLFNETISTTQILGIIVIIVGVVLTVTADE